MRSVGSSVRRPLMPTWPFPGSGSSRTEKLRMRGLLLSVPRITLSGTLSGRGSEGCRSWTASDQALLGFCLTGPINRNAGHSMDFLDHDESESAGYWGHFSQMLKNNKVLFVGYRIPHPLEPYVEIRVQTTSDTTPQQELVKELDNLVNLTRKVAKNFKDEATRFGFSNMDAGDFGMNRDMYDDYM